MVMKFTFLDGFRSQLSEFADSQRKAYSVSFNSRCRYFEEFACKQVATLNPCVNLFKFIAHRYFFDPRMCKET